MGADQDSEDPNSLPNPPSSLLSHGRQILSVELAQSDEVKACSTFVKPKPNPIHSLTRAGGSHDSSGFHLVLSRHVALSSRTGVVLLLETSIWAKP